MKAFCKTFLLLLASLVLASCGGGGNGDNSAFGGGPVLSVTITPASASIGTNSFTTLTVAVKNPDGTPAQDGAAITATLTPATIGTLSGASGSSGTTATNALSGGITSFTFNSSNQAGVAHIIASITVITSGSVSGNISYSGSTNVTVNGGNTQDPRLQLSATSTTLPLNPYNSGAYPFPGNYIGSPYISEVTITWRHTNGQLVSGTTPVNVSIDPVTVAGFSTLDDPATEWTGADDTPPTATGNEFLTILGSGPVNVTGGNGAVFVHSFNTPGTTTLSVTAVDPDSGQTISSQLTFTVAGSASSNLPASITALADSNVYVSGSGGPQSTQIRATVTDGNGVGVADPSGFDNVQFEIVGPAGNDARLSGVDAAGHTVTGTKIATVTHNGIAGITFLSGALEGPVQVKATVDRGDNNVDNQIQDALSATATVVVSDGKLFSIKITNPAINPNLLPVIDNGTTTGTTTPTPVYNVPVTVLATDRQGNPVLPGTQIGFGLIDAPVFGYPDQGSGTFELSGNDGNPQEGGNLFTAPTGAFETAGGGAGPGDALVLFGKETSGDADLESARTVQRINNEGSLNVSQAFNLNDTTGVSVNTGNNIPYVIGRATAGNIDAVAFTGTDSDGAPNGVASVTLRYPQSRIGQSAVIWAQGTGTTQGNAVAKTVADAVRLRYLGIGPAVLFAEPETIFGNSTQTVTVCLQDAVGSPIPGQTINFSFTGLNSGTGTADGKTSGALAHPTGADGCSVTSVVTTGIQPGSAAQIVFTISGLSASVKIDVGNPVLTAKPTTISSSAGATPRSYGIALLLKDGLGNPVPGATITGTCAGGGNATLDSPSYVTGSNGTASAVVTTTGFCVANPPTPSSVCTFTYSQGTATATANVTITGVASSQFSPPLVCI